MKRNVGRILIIISALGYRATYSRVDNRSQSDPLQIYQSEESDRRQKNSTQTTSFQNQKPPLIRQSTSPILSSTPEKDVRASTIYAKQPDQVKRTYEFLNQPQQTSPELRHSFTTLPIQTPDTSNQEARRALWDEAPTLNDKQKQSTTYQELTQKLTETEKKRIKRVLEQERKELEEAQNANLKKITALQKDMENNPALLSPSEAYKRLQNYQKELETLQNKRTNLQQQAERLFPSTSIGIRDEIQKQQNSINEQREALNQTQNRLAAIAQELEELPAQSKTISIRAKPYENLNPEQVKDLANKPISEKNEFSIAKEITEKDKAIGKANQTIQKNQNELQKLSLQDFNSIDLTKFLTSELQKNQALESKTKTLQNKISELNKIAHPQWTITKSTFLEDLAEPMATSIIDALPLPRTERSAYALAEMQSLKKQLSQLQEEKRQSDKTITSLRDAITYSDQIASAKAILVQEEADKTKLLLDQARHKIENNEFTKDDLIAATSNQKRKLLEQEQKQLVATSQRIAEQVKQDSASIEKLQQEANSPQTQEKDKELQSLINQQAELAEEIKNTETLVQTHKESLERYTSGEFIAKNEEYNKNLEALREERNILQNKLNQNSTALEMNSRATKNQEKILEEAQALQQQAQQEQVTKTEEKQETPKEEVKEEPTQQLQQQEEKTAPPPRKISQKIKDFFSFLKSKTKAPEKQTPSIYKERVNILQKNNTGFKKVDAQEEKNARQEIEKEIEKVREDNETAQKEIRAEIDYLKQLETQGNVPAGIIQLQKQQVDFLQSIQNKEKQKQNLLTSFYWLTPGERRGKITSLRQEALKLTKNGDVLPGKQEEFDLYFNLIKRHEEELQNPTQPEKRFKEPYFYASEQLDTTKEEEGLKIIQETFEEVTRELLESDELLRVRTRLKERDENISQEIKDLEKPPEGRFQEIKNDLDKLTLQKATIEQEIDAIKNALPEETRGYLQQTAESLEQSIKSKEERIERLNKEVINLQKELRELDSGSTKALEVQINNANDAIKNHKNQIESYNQQIEQTERLIKTIKEEANREKPRELDYKKEFQNLTSNDIENLRATLQERIKRPLDEIQEEKKQVENELKDLEKKRQELLNENLQAVKRVNQYNRNNIKLEELKEELERDIKAVEDQKKVVEKLKSEAGNVGNLWNSKALNNATRKLEQLKQKVPQDSEGLLKAIDIASKQKSYAQEINVKKNRLKELELDEAAHKINDRSMEFDSELTTLEYSKRIDDFNKKIIELQNLKERAQASLAAEEKWKKKFENKNQNASQNEQQIKEKMAEIEKKEKEINTAKKAITTLKEAQEAQQKRENLQNQLQEIERNIQQKTSDFTEEQVRQELEEDQRKKNIQKLEKEREQVSKERIQLMPPAERRTTIVLLQNQLENPTLSDEIRKKINEELEYHQNELLHPQIFSFKSKVIPDQTFMEKAASMASSAMKWAQEKISEQITQPPQKTIEPLPPAKPFELQKELLPERQTQKRSLLHPIRSYKAWREGRAQKALEKSEQKIENLLNKQLRTATPNLDALKDLEVPLEVVKRTSDEVLQQEDILKKVGAATYAGNIMNIIKAGRDTHKAGTKLIKDKDQFISYDPMRVRQYAQESRRIQREGGILTKAVEEQFRDDRLIKEAAQVEKKLLKKYPKIIAQIDKNITSKTTKLSRIDAALKDLNTTTDHENLPQKRELTQEREQLHKEILELEVKRFTQHSNYLQLIKDQNQETIYQLQQPHSPSKKALLVAKLEQNEEIISKETLASAQRLNEYIEKYINEEETDTTLKNIREEYGRLITEYMQQQSRYQQEKELLENREPSEALKAIDKQLEELNFERFFKKLNQNPYTKPQKEPTDTPSKMMNKGQDRVANFIKLSEKTSQGRTLLQQKESYTKPRTKKPAQPTPFDQNIQNLEKNIAELKDTTHKVRKVNYNVILRFFKDPTFNKDTPDKINRTFKEKVSDAYQAFKRLSKRVSSLTKTYYKEDELLVNAKENNRARNKLEREILSSYKKLSENLQLAQKHDLQQLEKANKLLSINPDNAQLLKMRSDVIRQIQERDAEINRVTQERIQLQSEYMARLADIVRSTQKPEDFNNLLNMQKEAQETIDTFTKEHTEFLSEIDKKIAAEPRSEEKIDLMRLRVQKMHDYSEFAKNITIFYEKLKTKSGDPVKMREKNYTEKVTDVIKNLQEAQGDITQYLTNFFEANPAVGSEKYPAQSLQEELDKMKKLEWEIKQNMLPKTPTQQEQKLDPILVEPLKYGLAIQTP